MGKGVLGYRDAKPRLSTVDDLRVLNLMLEIQQLIRDRRNAELYALLAKLLIKN